MLTSVFSTPTLGDGWDGLLAAPSDSSPLVQRQEAMVALGRRAISPPDLMILTLEAAAMAADQCGVDRYAVAEPVADGRSLRFRVGRTEAPVELRGAVEFPLEMAAEMSLSGYALHVARPVVASDLAAETRFRDELLLEQGVSSAICCPMTQQKKVFGTIGVYSSKPHVFRREDVLFVESVSHLMATTIARQWAEQALAEQSRFTTAMFETVEAPILELTPEGRIIRLNQACQRVTGYSASEVKGRSVCGAFLIPEELTVMQNAFQMLRRGEAPVRFESCVLTKHGERRRIAWSFTVLRDPAGGIVSLLGTGIDTTAQHEALARLERVEAAADQALKSLEDFKQSIDRRELVFDADGNQLPHGLQRDRRRQPRRPFPYKQSLAPVESDRLPASADFTDVRCHDLSANGFSYLSPTLPKCTDVVVAFGTQPSLIYLVAKVIHVTPIEQDGQEQYLVGCKYTGRAAY